MSKLSELHDRALMYGAANANLEMAPVDVLQLLDIISAAKAMRGPHVSGIGLVETTARFDEALAKLEQP